MDDPFHLARFVQAQEPVYQQVCNELKNGRKRSHWMWFIFPQISGLGSSAMARLYAISSREEAEAYLNHAILGPRLRECTKLLNQIEGRSAEEILGEPDDLKFRSSLTLFANATPDNRIFVRALHKFFDGQSDELTLEKLHL